MAEEAWRFVARGDVIEHPEAWARVRIAARARDLARPRGHRRWERTTDPADHTWEQAAPDPGPEPDAEDVVAGPSFDTVRTALRRTGRIPAFAAALAFVARAEGATPVPECPTPRAGATPQQAMVWVGLWYAGTRSLFPGTADDTDATRQRRSRAMREVLTALRDAASTDAPEVP